MQSASVWVTWESKEETRVENWKKSEREREGEKETKKEREANVASALVNSSEASVRAAPWASMCMKSPRLSYLMCDKELSFQVTCTIANREREKRVSVESFVKRLACSLLGGIKWHREQEKINRHSIKSHTGSRCVTMNRICARLINLTWWITVHNDHFSFHSLNEKYFVLFYFIFFCSSSSSSLSFDIKWKTVTSHRPALETTFHGITFTRE